MCTEQEEKAMKIGIYDYENEIDVIIGEELKVDIKSEEYTVEKDNTGLVIKIEVKDQQGSAGKLSLVVRSDDECSEYKLRLPLTGGSLRDQVCGHFGTAGEASRRYPNIEKYNKEIRSRVIQKNGITVIK